MWTFHTDSGNSVYGDQTAKNIYLGETRIVTKLNSGTEPTYQEEYYKQYYYHSDHLGSASLISDSEGNEYQRIEYTPYGETWVEKTNNTGLEFLPYKFTAKELDEETGLYYYGARYLDPKYSRWISTDPALGDYIPQAPVSDEARKHNQNLPGMGGIFNPINSDLYDYGANNPVHYTDPDGNSVKNNTDDPIVVRTEHGKYVVLLKGDKYKGRQDGVLCPNGTTYKVFTLSNVKVSKDDNGNYKFSGGKIANVLTNLIKGIINFLFGKEKDKNDVYNNKFPKGWWEGKKDFTDKDIGDKADKSKGTVFEHDVDSDSNLSEWWASIQKDVDKQIKTKLKADE